MEDLPAYLSPEFSGSFRWLSKPLRQALSTRPGLIAAWIDASALGDRVATATATVPVVVLLVEPTREGSEVLTHAATQGEIQLVSISSENLEEALEADEEIASVIARGFRLLGSQREVFDFERHARSVVGDPNHPPRGQDTNE